MRHMHLSPTLILGHQDPLVPMQRKGEEKLQVRIISSLLYFDLPFCVACHTDKCGF